MSSTLIFSALVPLSPCIARMAESVAMPAAVPSGGFKRESGWHEASSQENIK